jgi:hypothetical protein
MVIIVFIIVSDGHVHWHVRGVLANCHDVAPLAVQIVRALEKLDAGYDRDRQVGISGQIKTNLDADLASHFLT